MVIFVGCLISFSLYGLTLEVDPCCGRPVFSPYVLCSRHPGTDPVLSIIIHLAEQAQVLQLSPAPGEKDYFFHLDEREGLSDLYDLTAT